MSHPSGPRALVRPLAPVATRVASLLPVMGTALGLAALASIAGCGMRNKPIACPAPTLSDRTVSTPAAPVPVVREVTYTATNTQPQAQPEHPTSTSTPQQDAAPADPYPLVLIDTSMGDIVLELDAEAAPITVANFLALTNSGYYDGTIVHRAVADSLIQMGGYDAALTRRRRVGAIPGEWGNGLYNVMGTVAAVRMAPASPNSADSEFYINLADNPQLGFEGDPDGFTVFGLVVKGMDVAEAIGAVPVTWRYSYPDTPDEPVIVEHVRRLTPDEAAKMGL